MTSTVPQEPRPLSATQRWRATVEAEHAQSDRARGEVPLPEDHWQPFAQRFRQDPRRTDDPLVERLAQEVTPSFTLLDIGAGGGRLALPLALRCRHVTAVEPSPAMVAELAEEAHEAGIHNVTMVQATWEEATVEPADVVLCSHVVYTVRKIEPFLRKLDAFARQRVVVLLYTDPPQSHLAPLWQRVYGEKRLRLPCLKELLEVLWEMAVYPDMEMLPSQEHSPFKDWDEAWEILRRRLYVTAGSPQKPRLEEAMRELLEEGERGLRVKSAKPMRLALVSWRP